jgi:hypothetical protein
MNTVFSPSPQLPELTVILEIPEELAQRLGPEPLRTSREDLGLEAHRQGLGQKPNSGNSWDLLA